jgi:hypothetical protein
MQVCSGQAAQEVSNTSRKRAQQRADDRSPSNPPEREREPQILLLAQQLERRRVAAALQPRPLERDHGARHGAEAQDLQQVGLLQAGAVSQGHAWGEGCAVRRCDRRSKRLAWLHMHMHTYKQLPPPPRHAEPPTLRERRHHRAHDAVDDQLHARAGAHLAQEEAGGGGRVEEGGRFVTRMDGVMCEGLDGE